MYAEHALQAFEYAPDILRVEIFDDVTAARFPDLVTDARKRLFEVVHEHLFEIAAVFSF